MHFKSFKLINYKSYRDSKEIPLRLGINIIAGQNNVGKTALLEGMSLTFNGRPHRSLTTLPIRTSVPNDRSTASFTFIATAQELRDHFLHAGTELRLPLPGLTDQFLKTLGIPANAAVGSELAKWFFENDHEFGVGLQRTLGGATEWLAPSVPTYGMYAPQQEGNNWILGRFEVLPDGGFISHNQIHAGASEDFGIGVAQRFVSQIYAFRAERFNIGVSRFGSNAVLQTNAANLPEVLNILQANTERFRSYNLQVQKIFPQIRQITVQPRGTDQLEILIWSHDPSSEREDLAVSLNESGTGIGQVLAILYVVMTSDFPRVIIIDEPQTFLHPGAARKLIDILRQNQGRHQFIIATHSPTIISAASPETITLTRHDGTETSLEMISTQKTEELRGYLAEVGVQLSDVFGADNIVWVEGPTEEKSFPQILERLTDKRLMGTIVKGIISTGEVAGKHADLVVNIYEHLSAGTGLLPPALAFVFDDDGRTATQKDDLRRRTHNRVFFTKRRMYENYLLDADAICDIVNQIEGFRNPTLTRDEIEQWLNDVRSSSKYGKPSNDPPDASWAEYADGAKVLTDLFNHFSEARVTYHKVVHSFRLTEWLLNNRPESLRELAELIQTAMTEVKT